MRLNDLFEAPVEEPHFIWYENPTKEQMNRVAEEHGKLHFIASPDQKLTVFPFAISFGDFVRAKDESLSAVKSSSVFGTAQKVGLGNYMVISIANGKYLEAAGKNLKNFLWLKKYLNINVLTKYYGEEPERETEEKPEEHNLRNSEHVKKNLIQTQDLQVPKDTKLKKTNLKKFIKDYGEQHGKN